ncbi:MBL fold metallo-hydrolase [Bacillus aquiflavi]|uniref:MBL fold metallo-hydrolase n=1 Tax=Bacillus aquiflavi TaxID=2672567 RepID=A0A6B3VZ82_9BACI|nr:MBL fold metallo-hydrolase [Bacillus aquiflavi]MBA4536554.1 MBL fold metallo-hydrolase [Bacillus aquiflavi]NEY80921.1 MBL fold metallo-hydrolase [Bacillus aquiflavi]
MLLRYFYDEKLAQASYLVGCEATGEAIIIDPARNIEQYLTAAEQQGMNIIAAAETHIHADFVSGTCELAVRTGATAYLSDEGDQDWKYQFLHKLNHVLVKDGDTFKIGGITFEVIHTPGHTPEHISFIVTDGGATQPIGIFTGDFVFVGDIGRPDLLEKAAGIQNTADKGAKQMFHSLQRFLKLPDFVQVWPAHGAGSACGKALGAVPSTTVGYEKRANWAFNYNNEAEFVKELLSDQPEPPEYFAEMKRVNKEGPALLSELSAIKRYSPSKKTIENWINDNVPIIDVRSFHEFSRGHIPGTINIPYTLSFTNWAGWFLDYNQPFYVIADETEINGVIHDLHSIGIDTLKGYMHSDILERLEQDGLELQKYEQISSEELKNKMKNDEVYVIDVRNESEYKQGAIPGSRHIMLGTLRDRVHEIPTDKPVVTTCQAGGRAAIATSILQAHGVSNVIHYRGGYNNWEKQHASTKC